jgi:hypothetical protein
VSVLSKDSADTGLLKTSARHQALPPWPTQDSPENAGLHQALPDAGAGKTSIRKSPASPRRPCMPIRPTPTGQSAPTCGDAKSGPPSPSRPASQLTVCIEHARADGHQNLIPRSTSNATSSSAASTSSRATVRWQADMTNGTTCIAEPSTSHQSGSGSAIPFHDPRDRL